MSEDNKIPADVGYTNNFGDVLNSTWGISTTGVLLSSGLSKDGVDPFYPAAYGWVFSPNIVTDIFTFIPDTNDV